MMRWFGESITGLRNQSWLFRWAAVTDDAVWITLGLSLPLAEYDDLGQLKSLRQLNLSEQNGISVDLLSLDDPLVTSPEITNLTETDDGGLIATTREGGLFVLDSQGSLIWGERFSAAPNLPLFDDWDRDGEVERLVSTSDGLLRFYDQQNFRGVNAVWEADCNLAPTCETSEDIDTLEVGRPICVGWTPLEGGEGYEVQLQTQSGTPLSTWQEAANTDHGILSTVELTPGNRYRIAVRAWLTDDEGGRRYTQPNQSDGFLALDDQPPVLSMSTSSDNLNSQNPEITFILSAEDRIGLSGWYLAIYTATGIYVNTIGVSSTSARTLNIMERWNGKDRNGRPVPPGQYLAIFGVTDLAGNRANVERELSVFE